MKLLIIDDEQKILSMLKRNLSLEGYEVTAVTEPHEAIGLMKTELFNLVLSDIKMPGMNGVDLLKELKQINPLANIIMMTGYSSMFSVVDCLGSGAVDYFVKPFDNLDSIKKALDEARTRLWLAIKSFSSNHASLWRWYSLRSIIFSLTERAGVKKASLASTPVILAKVRALLMLTSLTGLLWLGLLIVDRSWRICPSVKSSAVMLKYNLLASSMP